MKKKDYYILLSVLLLVGLGLIGLAVYGKVGDKFEMAIFGLGTGFISIFTAFAMKELGINTNEVKEVQTIFQREDKSFLEGEKDLKNRVLNSKILKNETDFIK